MNRRTFIKLIGLSGVVAAEGCASTGQQTLIPYLVPAEDVTPGVDSEYATVCRECPAGCGIVARVRDGRCHKLEGSAEHPINTGRLCIRGQSALQSLYHPDRSRQPLLRDGHGKLRPIDWTEALQRLDDLLRGIAGGQAAWIGPVETGAMDRLVDSWLAAVAPTHTRLRYEPFNYESLREAHRRVFGTPGLPDIQIVPARTLVSFGADFLETWLSNVQYARDFAQWRDDRAKGKHAGRFVFVGPRQGLTGLNADEWIPVRPGAEGAAALALAAMVSGGNGDTLAAQAGVDAAPLTRLAREIASGGPSLVLPTNNGQQGPGSVEADEAVLRLNQSLGNVGKTYLIDRPHALTSAATNAELGHLLDGMRGGGISLLFIQGEANLAYHVPAAAEAIQRVPTVVSFASCVDETTALASLVLPSNTSLESWGEYSPRPGITGIQQPVISPVFDTRDLGDVLLASAKRLGHDLGSPDLRSHLQKSTGLDNQAWMRAVERGCMPSAPSPPSQQQEPGNTPPLPPATLSITGEEERAATPPVAAGAPLAQGELMLHLYPSLHFYDGRTADRAWTQEIPEPATRAVWGSWAEIHPDTAKRMGIEADDVLALSTPHGRIEVPALPTVHVHPEVIAMQIGQGRSQAGRWAKDIGPNPFSLAAEDAWSGIPVEVKRLPVKRRVVVLQGSKKLVGEDVARSISLAESSQKDEERARRAKEEHQPSLYRYEPEGKHRWAMAIDLNRCIGCNACAAACYAENNVPIVGKDECERGREMSWLRIENYQVTPASARSATGSPTPEPPKQPSTVFLPMLCQQCNNAPCEYVCPVNATVHSAEGLNQQVYNRCVGTRFCSNNCPYKVRRFNWAKPDFPPPLDQQLNPDVIRRGKGVMEKCTFCVQRIRRARIDAEASGKPIADGEVQTACQQTCPADAIVFGDMNDPNSRVRQMAAEERGYGALAHLNTYPNITYLARVRAE